jgi:replicative superfamily II helicase
MNIFQKKLHANNGPELPIDPIELYETCAYVDGYGYLRGIQEEVLMAWHKRREERDVICKMNTGSGKTLTGLLMLYSKLIEEKYPVVYACPDKQLVEQTLNLSKLYGIPVCEFDTKNLPQDFVNSKKVLVATFQKLFNGKSVFNRDRIQVGSIVLDDAHKCVDIARQNSSLRLPRKHELSDKLFKIFEPSLEFQLPGSFYRLAGGDPTMVMKVPYWSWMDNHSKIIEIISDYVFKIDDGDVDDGIIFKWNFMADNLLTYDCYIGGNYIEINPIHVPYHEIPSFNEAKHRYILSATFEDEYDLIKDLGIEYKGVSSPIVPKDRKDVGRRLILAPRRFDPALTDDILREFIAGYKKEKLNVVVLVPSTEKTSKWAEVGAQYVDKDNITSAIEMLKSSTGNFMVFNNRYDGIDLNGEACRVLVVDGLPAYSSLQEQFLENKLESLRAGRKAQVVEQGLGRGVRSGADFCVIYLLGHDLVSFLGYEKNLKHFTPVTRAQINLGLTLLDDEELRDSLNVIKETADFCLTQNSSWLKYHSQALSDIQDELDHSKTQRLELAEIERLSLAEFRKRNYRASADVVLEKIIKKPELSQKEKAWYYQFSAQLVYLGDKSLSNDLQSKAANESGNLFHPFSGHVYKKIIGKDKQSSLVIRQLAEFSRPQDIIIHVNSIISDLQYKRDVKAKNFERSLFELGSFLGFTCQMPEKEFGDGPDGLWVLTDGHFLILEAKSSTIHANISKSDAEQLLSSETWFKNRYGEAASYYTVTLQSNRTKERNVSINEFMRVLDQEALELLHNNLRQFAAALQSTHSEGHTPGDVFKLLTAYKFTPPLFRDTYLKRLK